MMGHKKPGSRVGWAWMDRSVADGPSQDNEIPAGRKDYA